jgi:hypothetical protein
LLAGGAGLVGYLVLNSDDNDQFFGGPVGSTDSGFGVEFGRSFGR